MEFRLTYEGLLLGASRSNTRAEHKHEIRKRFHPQLKRLWEISPQLYSSSDHPGPHFIVTEHDRPEHTIASLSERFSRFGYRFAPIATKSLELLCGLEIIFLRQDEPGGVWKSGDIDNRLKTLIDALRVPNDGAELGKYRVPDEGENPFFCLLEDDILISKLSVEADTLLEPVSVPPNRNDARVVITVKLRPYNVRPDNLQFA